MADRERAHSAADEPGVPAAAPGTDTPAQDETKQSGAAPRDPDAEAAEAEAEAKEEERRRNNASAAALTLEIVGDLPHAEIKPPENILFVCKLNPVTRSDDLELIFSRFGKINSCEVIRDKKTGDSLQYAFVEYEDREAAERAYTKMQNVLIDDRRIWVDFSQSVSKLHNVWVKQRMGKGARAPPPRRSEHEPRGHHLHTENVLVDLDVLRVDPQMQSSRREDRRDDRRAYDRREDRPRAP
ncbi:peptidylprolyl isomerase [Malassezia brasiliensis]|uniref:peptidylprolyl isomerase n=1 Tax=Malassezia brasiliensis TaxID=1821822 RepID=A0AAF0DXD1_9BASI|nr:peptidylprolyl isomerase [Malassezia brasiliensis]